MRVDGNPDAISAEALDRLLPEDTPWRSFVLHGAAYGFKLGIRGLPPVLEQEGRWRVVNYTSAVAEQLRAEIRLGRLCVVSSRLPPTAALAVRPKNDGTQRVIVDHSLRHRAPDGTTILLGWNACFDPGAVPPCRLPSLGHLRETLPASVRHFAVVDIAAAYRHLRIDPGIGAGMVYHCDGLTVCEAALPMGASGSAATLQALTEAILHALKRKHPDIFAVVYLDDILIGGNTREKVQAALETLLGLLHAVRLPAAPHKIQGPATQVDYIGGTIDGEERTISFTRRRRDKYRGIATNMRQRLLEHTEVPDDLLQLAATLAGQLNFLGHLLPPIRALLSGLYTLGQLAPLHRHLHHVCVPTRSSLVPDEPTPHPGHEWIEPTGPIIANPVAATGSLHEQVERTRPGTGGPRQPTTPASARRDKYLRRYGRGTAIRQLRLIAHVLSRPVTVPFPPPPPLDPETTPSIFTDASTVAAGAVLREAGKTTAVWYFRYEDVIEPRRINLAELAVPAALHVLLPSSIPWQAPLLWYTDNQASAQAQSSWRATSPAFRALLEPIAMNTIRQGHDSYCRFLAGTQNRLADAVSRIPASEATEIAVRLAAEADDRAQVTICRFPQRVRRWVFPASHAGSSASERESPPTPAPL